MIGRRSKPHRVSRAALAAVAASGGLFGLSLIPYWMGLRYVADVPVIPLFLLVLASLAAAFFSAFRRAGKHILVRGLCLLLIAGIVLLGGGVAWLYVAFGTTPSVTRVEASPSGKHRLLIVDNGFIDSAYRAYPMVNAFLYRDVDSGWISYHDNWDDIDAPTVEWVSDTEARVWLPGTEGFLSEGSAEEIVVRFD